MEQLFITLTHALEGSVLVALGASFVWGILSILLSPCHLSSIPLIVGYISDHGIVKTRRAFLLSFLFALGILITIGLIGVITASLGRMMGDLGKWGNYGVAVIFFLVGLYLLDLIPLSISSPGQINLKRKGMVAALLLGLIFGIALGPCTFAYMAPILAVSFTVGMERLLFAIALLVFYGIGHCFVIVVAGTSANVVQSFLNWNERSRVLVWVKRICGFLVILGGFYLIWSVNA